MKSNIGHLELAAGVAGLIKVLLQLQHKTLVKSLHCEELNPYIQLEDSPFYMVREEQRLAAAAGSATATGYAADVRGCPRSAWRRSNAHDRDRGVYRSGAGRGC